MRVIPLALILTMLAACQLIPPPPGQSDSGRSPPSSATQQTNTDQDQWAGTRLQTPIPEHSTTPALRDWVQYQLHIARLPPDQLDKLKGRFDPGQVQKLSPAAQLQWVLINLHHPQYRNLSQLTSLARDLATNRSLNEDSRNFAQQLLLWSDQLQRYEREAGTLREQLAEVRESKLELEQKIRKLSDIEETLNQRQREP